MTHPTPDQLSAQLDGALQDAAFDLVRHHLELCELCRVQCMRMATADEVLAALLTHDPDDRFFAALERFLEEPPNAKAATDSIPPELDRLFATEIARLDGLRRAAVSQAIPRAIDPQARAPRAPSAEPAGLVTPTAAATR